MKKCESCSHREVCVKPYFPSLFDVTPSVGCNEYERVASDKRNKCRYEGTGKLEGLCMGTKELDSCIGYDACLVYKPKSQTNAERIRAMSDEELAVELIAYRDDWDDYETHVGCFDKWEDALKAEVDWLKQPVKDGEGE